MSNWPQRRLLPLLLTGFALVACAEHNRTDANSSPDAGAGWQRVIEPPPLAEAIPTGTGWQGVVEPPPLAEAIPTGSGWQGVIEPPPLAEPTLTGRVGKA
jgi:hypothetical protein